MKEHEMRRRLREYLRQAATGLVLPATLGMGLTLGGCGDDNEPAVKYGAPYADARVDTGAQPEYAAPFPDGAVAKYAAPFDAGVDEMVAKYAAPFDAGDDGMVVKYAAPFDAGDDLGPQPKYAAVFPDAGDDGQMTNLYAAPFPDASS